MHIEINDDKALMKACDLLHDAKFDLIKMKYDQEGKKWEGIFKREFFEDPTLIESKRKFIIFSRHAFPMAEAVLTLNEVASITVVDKAKIEIFTFNECQQQRGNYRLVFCEDMEILINFVSQPKGYFRDIKLLDEKGSLLTFRDKFL